jgi:hypothetical protein
MGRDRITPAIAQFVMDDRSTPATGHDVKALK